MNKKLFCNKYNNLCNKFYSICNLDNYYNSIIRKTLLISFIFIIIITIILSVGLNSQNYFGWLNKIEYNPIIV